MNNIDARFALLAACMMHVEGYYSTLSLAFKNHNPGNIRQDASSYKTFPTALDGFLALVNDITANKGKTLRTFIAKYAPPVENNTSQYLTLVSELSGIGADDSL